MAAGEIVRYLSRHGSTHVAGIVLVSPTTPFLLKTDDNPDGVERKRFDELRSLLSKDVPHLIASGIPGLFFGQEQQKQTVSNEMIQWTISLCLIPSLKALIECNRAMTETDFRAEMRKITVPSLIVHGDADQSAPLLLTGKKSAELIPN